MTPSELYTLFRQDLVDIDEPQLWTDNEVYAYMNDAYFMFVRLTGGVPDGTSELTQIVAYEGDQRTDIDKSIMRIRTAVNVTDGNRPLKIINVDDLESLTGDDYGVLRASTLTTTPNRVRHMIIGESEEHVRWGCTPDKDYEIQLVVERLPCQPITSDSMKFADVREEHHYHLLKWMRHLAYRKQDTDSFDLVKSDQERNDFMSYCVMAKNEKDTRKHKVRVTAYGGI